MRRSTFSLLRASILTALLGCPPGDKADDTASGARCTSPTSILLADGSASGFVRCEDGAINRVSAEAVDPTIDTPACVGDEEVRACESDAECTDGAYAKCISYIDSDTYIGYGDSWTACGCVYSCASDADCASGEVCLSPDVEPLVWPIGPGALPYGGVFVDTSARGVMLAVIEEACVGETMGAAELLAAADGAEEPALATALRKAGEDEARHAALAWRMLACLLDTHPELRPEAEGALAARVARARSDGPTDSPDLPAYGVPSRAARAAVHAQVLDDLVPECLGALRAA